jgi:hypothetical protein
MHWTIRENDSPIGVAMRRLGKAKKGTAHFFICGVNDPFF